MLPLETSTSFNTFLLWNYSIWWYRRPLLNSKGVSHRVYRPSKAIDSFWYAQGSSSILNAKQGLFHKIQINILHLRLNFHLGQAMLPDNDIWCNTVLAVIEKYDPVKQYQHGSEVFGLFKWGRPRTFPQGPKTRRCRNPSRRSWAKAFWCSNPAHPSGTL